jgi:hypothetical protein
MFEGHRQCGLEKIQFPVHGDTQSLEGPGGRMNPPVPIGRRHGVPDDLGQPLGAFDISSFTLAHDRPTNHGSIAFLSKTQDQLPQFLLGAGVHDFRSAYTLFDIESHIEWLVPAKGKAPFAGPVMEHRYSQIEKYTLRWFVHQLRKGTKKLKKIQPEQPDPPAEMV